MTQPRKAASLFLLLLATAIMLPLLFPPFYCFFLAPIALVPFAIAVLRRPMKWRYAGAYYLLGAAFFLPNLFWLAPVTVGGYIALAFFVALYFPLFAWGFHRLVVQFRMPATFALPIAWTAAEFTRANFIQGGFPWFILGNCLTPAPVLIQTADIFGVWTLTFLICMTNGCIVDLLRLPRKRDNRFNPTLIKLIATTAGVLLFAVAYGFFRLNQSTTTPGPRVAVIQENIPQELKDNGDPVERFMRHIKLTKDVLAQLPKPDLVVWPETMVPGYSNKEFLEAPDSVFTLFKNPEDWPVIRSMSQQYVAYLQNLANDTNTPLLVGAVGLIPRKNLDDSIKQNLTLLIVPRSNNTGGPVEQYAKIHLVPWGEYIPFRDIPVIGDLMRALVPIDFDYSNTPGAAWTRFDLLVPPNYSAPNDPNTKNYTFCTPICFEDTMPEPARLMSLQNDQKTDFLLNVSNDGWFQYVELDQHLQCCQLRAVENRIPIARSVNTGDSGFIDSNGRLIRLVMDPKTGSSINAIGAAAENLSLDSRISLYSRIGDILPILSAIAGAILIAYTYARPRRSL